MCVKLASVLCPSKFNFMLLMRSSWRKDVWNCIRLTGIHPETQSAKQIFLTAMLVIAQFSATMVCISLISPPELRVSDNFFKCSWDDLSKCIWITLWLDEEAPSFYLKYMNKTNSIGIGIWEQKNTQQACYPRHIRRIYGQIWSWGQRQQVTVLSSGLRELHTWS